MVKLIRKTIEIFDQKIGRDSPDRFKFTLKDFSKIHYGELRIQLAADTPSIIPLTSWRMTKLRLNGRTFFPSDPVNSVNIVHQSKDTCNIVGCVDPHLNLGENELLVFHESPLGTAIFLPDINARGEINLVGEPQENPVILAAGGAKDIELGFEKINQDFNTLVTRNTPLAIAVLVLVTVIVLGIAFILFRSGGIISDVKGVGDAI